MTRSIARGRQRPHVGHAVDRVHVQRDEELAGPAQLLAQRVLPQRHVVLRVVPEGGEERGQVRAGRR